MSNAFALADLINAVYVETNRVDLVAETLQAVLSSTLKMHGMEFFYKDIATAQVVFDAPGFLQTLDTQTMPFFRSINAFRKDNPSLYQTWEQNPTILPPLSQSIDGSLIPMGQARAFLKFISIDDILDEFGAEKSDVCYQAGSTIMIRSSTSLQFGLVTWYAWPNLDMANANAGYSSWIAQEYPYAIIFDAASSVLQKIGMTDAARKYDNVDPKNPGLVWSHVNALLLANITPVGG